MVDCGSVNQTLRDGDVPLSAWYETLGERYAPAQDRYFLLTHYHKDHIAGFFKLLEREEGYFHRCSCPGPRRTKQAAPFCWSTPCSPTCSSPPSRRTTG